MGNKKAKAWHTCHGCGSTFQDGNNIFGEPNGLGFVIPNVGTINICNACVRKVGTMSDLEKELFLDELKRKAKK